MNNDGWNYGAGPSDNRLAGEDLQHNRQTRTADELHSPVRKVRDSRESGGPMKVKDIIKSAVGGASVFPKPGALLGGLAMEGVLGGDKKHEGHHKSSKHEHLEAEKARHAEAMEHHKHHVEKHNGRHYDSQHGHDDYKY